MSFEEKFKRKMQQARRKEIMSLIQRILRGEINSSKVPLDQLFQLYTSERDQYLSGPRKEYISPADRSGYNYGYMTSGEMGEGSPI